MSLTNMATFAPDFADDAQRWRAVEERDPDAHDMFVYAVRTTGVFCRPTCPVKRPRRSNVEFHPNAAAARAAGFRACLRCHPEGDGTNRRHLAAVIAACRAIQSAVDLPRLDDLAAGAGMSSSHFHRLFRAETGITPREYAAHHRAERVRAALRREGTITGAIYGAGFESSSRFYEASTALLGMTPKAFRRGGAGEQIHFAVGECWLGSVLVASSARGICALSLGDDPEALVEEVQDQFHAARLIGGDTRYEQTVAAVIGFLNEPAHGLKLPLDIRGTAFQKRVWDALLAVPPGSTLTYAELARMVGAPTSARAVARACAANVLAVAIPCHRVIRGDGTLAGYRWGVERKKRLLDRERSG